MDRQVSSLCCELLGLSAADLVVLEGEYVHPEDADLCWIVIYYNDGAVCLGDEHKVKEEMRNER